jgi:hypothetical protein
MAQLNPDLGDTVDGEGPKVRPHEPAKRAAGSWQAWATRLLLVAVAAVILLRAGRFATRGVVLDSHDETTWLGWAWRDPGVAELWGRAAERLAPGERVVLLLPADADPVWTGVMAVYHLSGQELVEVRQGRIDRPLPPGATVVRLRRDGTVRIRRPGAAP